MEGRVLRFEQCPGRYCHASYWALEAAIERHGRALERGISFKAPYAIATWPEGDEVELLAINHWREEEATPIRLLYPETGTVASGQRMHHPGPASGLAGRGDYSKAGRRM